MAKKSKPTFRISSLTGFKPITPGAFIESTLKANKSMTREELTADLQAAMDTYLKGERCSCGNPIWIAGSALMGPSCFQCITCSAMPDDDYEIDIAWLSPQDRVR